MTTFYALIFDLDQVTSPSSFFTLSLVTSLSNFFTFSLVTSPSGFFTCSQSDFFILQFWPESAFFPGQIQSFEVPGWVLRVSVSHHKQKGTIAHFLIIESHKIIDILSIPSMKVKSLIPTPQYQCKRIIPSFCFRQTADFLIRLIFTFAYW